MLRFSKGHYFGITILICCIGLLQLFIYWYNNQKDITSFELTQEEKSWLLVQNEIDSIKEVNQENSNKIYPFNPNFISDYKGYKLGMTEAQIDKLHHFRKQNKYVNSNSEFQSLTGVSKEWMKQYAIYFKFPDWVTNKSATSYKKFQMYPSKEKVAIIQKDINAATKEDLIAVYGIGEKLADKILIEKEKFGGFVSLEQFQFIWGISPEAIEDLQKRFFVKNTSSILKVAINELSIKELAKFPYFNYALAKEIVIYRSMNNGIKEISDLTKIKGMPNEKIKIIALYLEF